MMKKLILLALVAVIMAGCCMEESFNGEEENLKNKSLPHEIINDRLEMFRIKGHDYIVFDGISKGGIIHAESCPCKERRQKDLEELVIKLKEE